MVFLILVFTKPTVIDVLPVFSIINILYDVFRVVLMITMILWYICTKRNSILNISLVLVYATLFLSTVKFGGDIRTVMLQVGSVFACCMAAEIFIEETGREFLYALKNVLSVYILINFITLLLFPDGWYKSGEVLTENWFLGNKNLFIMFHLVYLFCVFTLRQVTQKKISQLDKVVIAMVLISTLVARSSTSTVGIAVFFVIYFMKNILKKSISAFTGLITTGILFFLIVLNNMTYIFSFLIVNVLHKDLTLTVRVYVWERALEWFETSPIFGVGVQATELIKSKLFSYSHPHNTYLYFLLFGGLITFVFFILYLIFAAKKIDSTELVSNAPGVAAIWSLLIIWLTDVYSRPELFFMMIIIAANIDILKANGSHRKSHIKIKL